MLLPIGTKVDLAFSQKGSNVENHVPGVIVDEGIDKADGANGPVGRCYKIISLETARPENGGHEYLGERTILTTSWSIAPRDYPVPQLDDQPTTEALVAAMYRDRQKAHIARIQAQDPNATVEATAPAEALPF